VIVDLTDATFIDSTTLGVLIGAVRRLRANEGRLSVVCNDRNVARTFELSGLDRVFDIFPTRDQAIARLDGEIRLPA
jgi:anti-sigma B factor antagonist